MSKNILLSVAAIILTGCSGISKDIYLSGKNEPSDHPVIISSNNIETEATGHFNKGTSHLKMEDKTAGLKDAEAEFLKAVSLKPDMFKAYLNLGLISAHMGESDKAMERFNYVEKNGSEDMRDKAAYNLGILYALSKDYPKAIAKLNMSKDENRFFISAIIHMMNSEFDQADTFFREILSKDKDNPYANLYLGMIYIKKGGDGVENGIELVKHAVNIKPDLWEGYFYLGNMYFESGDMKNSLDMFRKVTQIKQDNADAHYNTGKIYYANKDNDNAMTSFMMAARYNHYNAIFELTNIFLEEDKTDLALNRAAKMIDLSPKNKKGYFMTGLIYQKTGRYKDAAFYYQKTLDIDNSDIMARNNLAIIYKETGEIDKTLSELKGVLTIAPDSAVTHRNLGIIYDVYLDDLEKAEYHYREYYKLSDPDEQKVIEGWLKDIGRRRG